MRLHTVMLVATLALACLVAPRAADTQPKGNILRIGWVGGFVPSGPSRNRAAFQEGLREMGYSEGQNLIIESRYSGHIHEGFTPLVAELLRLPVDVLVTATTAATLVAREMTSTTPIVFTSVGTPVELGLIASLAQPGGNVTGIASTGGELREPKITMLKEIVPGLTRVAWLINPGLPSRAHSQRLHDFAATHSQLGVHVQEWAVSDPAELASAFAGMVREGAEALLVLPDGLFSRHCRQIADLAATHRLPALYGSRGCVAAGGLMSYGAHEPDRFRRVGVLVGKILKGAKPADLPVEQPMKFEFVINLKTAKALGITLPASILIRADEVIQ